MLVPVQKEPSGTHIFKKGDVKAVLGIESSLRGM